MKYRNLTGAIAVALLLCLSASAAGAQDLSKLPNWDGPWVRGNRPVDWDPTKPPGLGQQAPLTPEYQAIYENTRKRQKAGEAFDIADVCGPIGMPRVMAIYTTMEIVLKPTTTYFLVDRTSPIRRVFTDGRDWPKVPNPTFLGYSIGKWLDTDGDGTYDTLEIETRDMKGPRFFEESGIPLASDDSTVVKERIYLDKANPDIMHNDITTTDNALTRPWTVSRIYRREKSKDHIFEEFNCAEDNHFVAVGGYEYVTDSDGYLMPIAKDEPAPDPKYFQKYFPKK